MRNFILLASTLVTVLAVAALPAGAATPATFTLTAGTLQPQQRI
jgi:hypothetical protein